MFVYARNVLGCVGLVGILVASVVLSIVSTGVAQEACAAQEADPAQAAESEAVFPWAIEWENPGAQHRPLLIIHGTFGKKNAHLWQHPYLPFAQFGDRELPDGMRFLREECGLGGIVTSVSNYQYLRDENEWATFVEAVRCAREAGLRVWIYDEDRYPSLAAGGRVLEGRPDLEAKELVYDAKNFETPYFVRDCFEFTHASNNFAYVRRYPSGFNLEAVEKFLSVTHEEYKKRLGEDLFSYVEAFFIDEPSTNGVNTGLLPDRVRLEISKTIDEPDHEKKNLPMVPWFDDFPEVYQKLYGENLNENLWSLFSGDSSRDRLTRRRFWKMVADLYAERMGGTIATWCKKNGKFLTGHLLHEEELQMHIPNEGNILTMLRKMHIPGMDLTSSNERLATHGWRSAVFPVSAAILNNTRRVTTEVSDIDTYIRDQPRATLEQMAMCAAWQSAWGVTEFSLYYQVSDRPTEDFRAYCDFVGRLNAIVRDAELDRSTLLYYPIREMHSDYIGQKDRPRMMNQPERFQNIALSFCDLGYLLSENQVCFFSAGWEDMRGAECRVENGRCLLRVGNQDVENIVLPKNTYIHKELAALLETFESQGGVVIRAGLKDETEPIIKALAPRVAPECDKLVLGKFRRDGKNILLLLNPQDTPYRGEIPIPQGKKDAWILNPMSGSVVKTKTNDATISVEIAPRETILLIF
ncbi:MAG: hypothetical protein Q4D38_08150 [Planctomycetia bacterium]|nr:hypothetical protein [Planctomycetia bacterium]